MRAVTRASTQVLSRPRHSARRGITLVELVVVLVLISLATYLLWIAKYAQDHSTVDDVKSKNWAARVLLRDERLHVGAAAV